MSLKHLQRELKSLANPKQAVILQRFFKTGPGQYGEGDKFLGIKVPVQRQVAGRFGHLSLSEIKKLLNSPIHEERLVALLILVSQFQAAPAVGQRQIFNFYLKNLQRVNNWDLVDLSAPNIVGQYLLRRPRSALHRLVRSRNLWARRVAIIATYAFIKKGDYTDTLRLAKLLLTDRHDLIHKVVGWMLREVGKGDQKVLEGFLLKNVKLMPRTSLRYSIERLPEKRRRFYLELK